jgi:hypothetical protein
MDENRLMGLMVIEKDARCYFFELKRGDRAEEG